MAASIKKNKGKSSPASRPKAKSKSKVSTKVESKAKKTTSKVNKPKKVVKSPKVLKPTKVKTKEPKAVAKKPTLTKPKAKVKTPASNKTKTAVTTIQPIKAITKPIKTVPKLTAHKSTINVKPKSATEHIEQETVMPSNIAVMQEFIPENVISNITKPSESYMNNKQLEHFKSLLEQWKRELMEEVDHTLVEMKEAGVQADPNDAATQEETFNLELRTRDRERKLLKKIEEALQKIDNEEYGYCEACGIEIGIRRLEARPTATLCIDCKTLDEIKEKRS